MNEIYKKAYETYGRLWWLRDPFGMMIQAHLTMKFEKPFNAEMTAVFKALYPKRKKVNLSLLDEATIEPCRAKYRAMAEKYLTQKVRQSALLNSWLNANAGEVDLVDSWQVCYKQEAYTYGSQTNPMGYALGDVKSRAAKLEKRGIPYEIRRFGIGENGGIYFDEKLQSFHYGNDWHKKEKGYALYAPITDYMLDAIERLDNETLLEWAINCWRNGQNPKVLRPFLPDEIHDQSLAAYMKR